MTLTQNGINWICQNLGNVDECCVPNGLVYDYEGVDGTTIIGETGGTAGLVGYMAAGIVNWVKLTTPSRPQITPFQMHTANEQTVTLSDAQLVASHDGDPTSEDQWCYTEITPCVEHLTPTACVDADCYWYKKFFWEQETCHDKPLNPMERYLVYGGIGAAGLGFVILLARR